MAKVTGNLYLAKYTLSKRKINPLTPTTVAIRLQLHVSIILCQTGLSRHLNFHIRALRRSELSVSAPMSTRSQAVAKIADRTAKNFKGHVT